MAERQQEATATAALSRKIMGDQHPDSVYRVRRLKDELARWETERQAALARRAAEK
jgi:hypothetical protein